MPSHGRNVAGGTVCSTLQSMVMQGVGTLGIRFNSSLQEPPQKMFSIPAHIGLYQYIEEPHQPQGLHHASG